MGRDLDLSIYVLIFSYAPSQYVVIYNTYDIMAIGTGRIYLRLFQRQFYNCPTERRSFSELSALSSFYMSVANGFNNGRAGESNIVVYGLQSRSV